MSENRGAPQVARTTPGPWRAVEHEPAKYRIRGHVGPIEVDVAEVYGAPDDARLIAAAPDLLEALKALNLAFFGIRIPATDEQLPAIIAASNMARAAIAKASAP